MPAHLLGMPRYYFNVLNVAPHADYEGEELPDDEAAWREATSAGALLNDIDGKFRPGQEWRLEVKDVAGRLVHTICISLKSDPAPSLLSVPR
ncbi:hypothetical protein GA0061098_103059 [Bradyrhizobium shewense]|uniref:DUF6894 domain-containing protein n=1 Tax=Bradyrhizobium shewense TaxID=1761772 RepID=A0A1C3XR95_9BRAD|nr:hypothetical protein [Bradyrhizobium shewense]SCB54791.1 hypothetical protein GA0061098_103059 [Bradyrhizobium shewense]